MRPLVRRCLTISNVVISFLLWLPTILRIVQRHSSADISVLTLLLVLWLQIANGIIAYLDRSRSLLWYFALNGLNVLAALLVVVHYR